MKGRKDWRRFLKKGDWRRFWRPADEWLIHEYEEWKREHGPGALNCRNACARA